MDLNDGSKITSLQGPGYVALAIHTNNLNLGNNTNGNSVVISGNGVTIDDNGGSVFTTTGLLTITAVINGSESVRSYGWPVLINATASPTSSLLFTSTGTTGPGLYAGLYLDGDNNPSIGVAITANKTITVDQSLYVANNLSSGNWVITAPTVA